MAQSLKEKREERRRKRQEETAETVDSVEVAAKGITEGKGRPTPSRRKGEVTAEPEKSGNFAVRWYNGTKDYVLGVRSEIGKVTWPTRDEARRLTYIVTLVLIASAFFLGGLSILFTEIFNLGVTSPWVFMVVFVAFLVLLFVYARFAKRNEASSEF